MFADAAGWSRAIRFAGGALAGLHPILHDRVHPAVTVFGPPPAAMHLTIMFRLMIPCSWPGR
jgi:hypothetical protein